VTTSRLPTIVARFKDWSGKGLEHLVLRDGSTGWLAESVVIGDADGERFAAQYLVECDREWRATKVEVRVVGTGEGVMLSGDGVGSWRDEAEERPLPALNGAIDLDITCTPFTNTLPIRRLGLEAGQSADILVAYIDVPSLTVTADPQRYTCLEPMRRYRFESQGGDFVREIEVDEQGLVVLYPGLFKRVP
jgi:uncharacterized protein